MDREPVQCALEVVDDNPDYLGKALKCAQCALIKRVTVVSNVDGISEFKAGSCFLANSGSSMVSELQPRLDLPVA